MLKITNNRNVFFQWDVGQSLTVELEEGEQLTEVHIGNDGCNKFYVVEPIDNLVAVYDELLQSGKKIIAYEYIKNGEEGHTVRKNVFTVVDRPKATDYAYTPTESYSWEYWAERARLYAESAADEVASIPTKMAEWWAIHKPEIIEEIKTAIPPYDDTEIRAEISGIQQELNDKMEFYKLDTQVNGSIVTFYHDGVQLDFEAISEKYFDDKYFVYAECLDLTFIPCFPPTETDQAIEFISTYIYGGGVMVDRLIINSNNEGKFEEKYIAEKKDLNEKVGFEDYANTVTAGVIKTSPTYGTSIYNGMLFARENTGTQYSSASGASFISKTTLENVLAERLKEPQFELIEEIALTEDETEIRRTAEPNGIPYNFKKVLVMGNTKASTTAGVLRVECGVSAYVTNGLYTADRNVQALFEINEVGLVYGISNSGSAGTTSYLNNRGAGTKLYDLIIRPDTSGRVIPSGSKFAIYGIRA